MTKYFSSSKAGRWTLQGLLAASVVGLGMAGVMAQIDQGNAAEAFQVEDKDEPEALSLTTYSNVEKIRRSGNLSSEDLAALDMDEAEATVVLKRLAGWCKANERALSDSRQSIQRAQNNLREQQRLARTGQASQRDLADDSKTIQALYESKKAYQELSETGATYAMQAAPNRSAAWVRANELKGRTSLEMRYVTSLGEQRVKNLKSDADRQGVSLEKAMSRSELRELSEVRYRIQAKLSGIQSAEDAALPKPEEMRLEEEELQLADFLLEQE